MGQSKIQMPTLKDNAIKLALDNNWEEAILINQELLTENPKDIDSLKRLAYAYMQSGKFSEAKETYNAIIDLDSTNPISHFFVYYRKIKRCTFRKLVI